MASTARNKSTTQRAANRWSKLARLAIERQPFLDSWQAIGENGIGSVQPAIKISELIKSSPWHMTNLAKAATDLLRSAGNWADRPMNQESIKQFHEEILRQLLTIAAAYTVQGAMIGIGSLALE